MQSIAILDQEYPRFSAAELAARHERTAELLAEAGRAHLVVWVPTGPAPACSG